MRERTLWVRRGSSVILLVVVFALASSQPASATVLDFESLPCGAIGSTFGLGFTFSDAWAIECNSDYQGTWGNSPANSAPGTRAAGNRIPDDTSFTTISRAAPFDFVSAQVSSFLVGNNFDFGTPQSSPTLLIQGYLNNMPAGSLSIDFTTLPLGYNLVGGLFNVDRLDFFSFSDLNGTNQDYWLLDDLNLTDAAVPEPASLLLLGAGLSVVVVRLRTQRRRNGRTTSNAPVSSQ